MKHFLLLSIFTFLFLNESTAQLEHDICPEITHCLNGVFETSDFFPVVINDYEPAFEICPDNLLVYGLASLRFLAVSSYLDVSVLTGCTSDCGISAGLKDACNGDCIVSETCLINGVFFDTDELIPGHEYIFYVVSCGGGGFNFDVTLSEGVNETDFSIESVELAYQDECYFNEGPEFCCNEDLYIKVETEDYEWNEILQNYVGNWLIQIDGEVFEFFEVEDLYSIDFCSLPPGDYVLTLISLGHACDVESYNLSYEFTINDLTIDFGRGIACQHELESGYWRPDNWEGDPIVKEGFHLAQFLNECGCLVDQIVEIEVYEEGYIEHQIELCPDDYPYDFFDGYELDQEEYDYDVMLRFNGESLVEDIDGINCDSLIHLFVVNENPGERCSYCDVPVAVLNNLVYCVPFDNGTFDVSGNNNRIYAEGIRYDNHGSESNPLWEAEFDGRDDHVWIPHFDDLNTFAFTLDFKFNKDSEFDDGRRETLISKGDGYLDNKRFEIFIEEQSANAFNLTAKFFTESDSIEISAPNLNLRTWYGITVVVEEDSISLFINGYLYNSKIKAENLRSNEEKLYLGIHEFVGVLTSMYKGRMDEFRYWKQKLSDQDILYLYYPEKQYEVNIDMNLRCCESGTFRDIEVDQSNPNDSLIIPGAGSTGYDSVYIVNMIPVIEAPIIIESMIPEDIILDKYVECNGSCNQIVSWQEPSPDIFSDHCEIISIESSHNSPVMLTENISYVEIEYTATNECGQSSSYSFAIELYCEKEEYNPLPEDNWFEIVIDEACEEHPFPCVGSEIGLRIMNVDYTLYDSLNYTVWSNNDRFRVFVEEEEDLYLNLPIEEENNYMVTYWDIESKCDEVIVEYHDVINVVEGYEIDHGVVFSCSSSIEENLPDTISNRLKNIISGTGQTGVIQYVFEDDCSCEIKEKIEIYYFEESYQEWDVFLCPGENFQGYTESGTYEEQHTNSVGCDSIIVYHLTVLDETDPDCISSSVYDLNENNIFIYPNPTMNRIWVNGSGIVQLEFYDISGRKFEVISDGNGFDLSYLSSGLFIVQIENRLFRIIKI